MGCSLNADTKVHYYFPKIFGSSGRIMLFLIVLIALSCTKSDNLEFLAIEEFPNRQLDFSMWQLAQFDFEVQMCYIIKTDDGKITVIDGGMPTSKERVVGYLKQMGGHVHNWIITHPHLDHIGVLQKVLKEDEITIDRLFHSKLDDAWVLRFEEESSDLVSNYNKTINESSISVIDASSGDIYPIGSGVELEIIAVKNDSIVSNAVNNSSLVFKISSKSKTILFLGDLGVEGGKTILKTIAPEKLKADYVQMAHHGQGGVSLEFYKAVEADYALWPTPKWLWENKAPNQGPGTGNFQTPEVRAWTENELNIKTNYVAGLEGNIQID